MIWRALEREMTIALPREEVVHSHEFSDIGSGTLVRDRVLYQLPWSPLGEITHPIVRRKLDHIFDFRRAQIHRLLSPQRAAVVGAGEDGDRG